MRFTFWPGAGQPWDRLLDGARHADETGWDRICVADHFMADEAPPDAPSPMLEATAVLAALAAVTERARLTSLVFGITYRHPAVLANWAATMDHLSGGRFDLGVGAGWQLNEHAQYHIELGPPGERIDRFVEALEVLEQLLRHDVGQFQGEYFQLTDARCDPKPVQDPMPVLIGGKGDRMMGVVARYADEWNMWATPETFAERTAALDRACERIGRDPATIARSAVALWFVGADDPDAVTASAAPRPVVAGSVEQMRDLVGRYADLGCDELIVPDFTMGRDRADALDTIITDVAER